MPVVPCLLPTISRLLSTATRAGHQINLTPLIWLATKFQVLPNDILHIFPRFCLHNMFPEPISTHSLSDGKIFRRIPRPSSNEASTDVSEAEVREVFFATVEGRAWTRKPPVGHYSKGVPRWLIKRILICTFFSHVLSEFFCSGSIFCLYQKNGWCWMFPTPVLYHHESTWFSKMLHMASLKSPRDELEIDPYEPYHQPLTSNYPNSTRVWQ